VSILAIDAWEHAHYLQYENDKRAFFDAIWSVVDWPGVAARLDHASLDAPRPPTRQ
jgi:Fe-Mn family superoxide dismutase